MIEDFVNALRSFRLNKTRSFLSLLGVIIGVASVILITTLGQSATASMLASFGDSGMDIIELYEGWGQYNNEEGLRLPFTESFRQELWENIEGLEKIYYNNPLNATLRYDGIDANGSTRSIENEYLEVSGVELEDGRFFTISEYANGAQKIILGAEIAKNLFPDGGAVGSVITMDTEESLFGFEVIGVLKEKSTIFERFDTNTYVPREFFIKKIQPNPNASYVSVKVKNADDATAISTKIEEYILKKTGHPNMLQLWSMADIIEQQSQVMGILTVLLSSVAAISLLVGGIGIMNIMIVTVTERKKEIGIRKALGATPFAIRGQFLVEAATITLLGGIFGIILGVLLSMGMIYVLNMLQLLEGVTWIFEIQWNAITLAFVFSVFIGVFFGYSPASRASKLDPVEALSSE